MRIVLVNPLYRHFPGSFGQPGYAEPPVGLACLAAYLREKGDCQVNLIDNCAQNLTDDELVQAIVRRSPDVVGFYSSTLTIRSIGDTSGRIKEKLPAVKVIVGGPHISARPEDLPAQCDAAVIREGEQSALELLQAFERNDEITGIEGVSCPGENDELSVAPARKFIDDLDSLPFPAWDLLRTADYTYQYPTPSKNKHFRAVLTGRGCPFNCTFCAKVAVWGQSVRRRSVANVLTELTQTQAEGIDLVFFRDDTFNHDRNWLNELIEGLETLPLPLTWSCLARLDLITDESAQRMARAGCFEMHVGLESGNAQTVAAFKHTDLAKLLAGVKACRRAGIRTKGTFILGLPGENETSVGNTINVAKKCDPDYAFFSCFVPYPGTAHFDEYRKKRHLTTDRFELFNYHGYPIVDTPQLSATALFQLRRKAYRGFYLRPRKAWQLLRDTILSGRFSDAGRAFNAFRNLTGPQNRATQPADER